MIGAIVSLLVIALASPTHEQSTPRSPCPNVFSYEPPGTEPGRWYGVVNLSTDSTLHSLWLNIVLDEKADILGNWVGDVTTTDNTDFKIENTKMKIHPGPAVAVRFFVQYNQLNARIPRLQAIRLNGREICNANTRQPTPPETNSGSSRPADRPEPERPVVVRPVERPRPQIKPEDTPVTRPVHSTTSTQSQGPVYVPTSNPPIDDVGANPYLIKPDDGNVYFEGGLKTVIVPKETNNGLSNNNKNHNTNNDNNKKQNNQCGKVTQPNLLVVNGKPTLEGQWPWQIALYQTQTVDSKYICGGTLLTHRHVITAAHCVTRPNSNRVVNKNTLIIFLGKHNLRTSANGVQIRQVEEITVHPSYNAESYSRDMAILTLKDSVEYTHHVRPICLWPDNLTDLTNVIGRKGSVVGWGFDETGVATEELSLIEMPVVSQETCIRSFSEFFAKFTSDYTYCAGYRDGALDKRTGVRKSTSVCNGDSGGGMVFEIGNTWYLRGLVSLSVARQNERRCDPSHYVVFTDLAKVLPWIRQNINSY